VIRTTKEAILHFLKGIFFTIVLTQIAFATDCDKSWMQHTSHVMTTESEVLSLIDYANGERHISVKQGNQRFEVYYLKDILLIKGLSSSEIERVSQDTVWWLPMGFMVPITVLSEAVPQGPCHLNRPTFFSIDLKTDIKIESSKLIKTDGILSPSSSGEILYKFAAAFDPPFQNSKIVMYEGTINFTPPSAVLGDDVNITGYTVIGDTRPFRVVGSSALPVTTLGELKSALVQKTKVSEPSANEKKGIIMAPERVQGTGDADKLYPLAIGGKIGKTGYVEGSKIGFVDKGGYVIVEPKFSLILDFHDDIAVFQSEAMHGYVDKKGQIIVEAQFNHFEFADFSEGLVAVKKEGKWGFINKTGKFVIEPQFSFFAYTNPQPSFSEGLAGMQKALSIKLGDSLLNHSLIGSWTFMKDWLPLPLREGGALLIKKVNS
jgi:hypothetical protein